MGLQYQFCVACCECLGAMAPCHCCSGAESAAARAHDSDCLLTVLQHNFARLYLPPPPAVRSPMPFPLPMQVTTVDSQLYVAQLHVPLVYTSNWFSLQNTLHDVIRKIIFTCTALSVFRPILWVPTWTYYRESTVKVHFKGCLLYLLCSTRFIG